MDQDTEVQMTQVKRNEVEEKPVARQRKERRQEEWNPVTKLGRLVQNGYINSFEEIFKFCIPIKEYQIVDFLFKKMEEQDDKFIKKEEVMQIKPVQKQTKAGQRTRFKAYMAIGDQNGHIGLGWASGKDVSAAIKAAIINAKLNIIPVRFGYWGNKIGNAHTIPIKCTGKSGSVSIRIIPAPRGTSLVAAPASKKIFQFAGIEDVFTSSRGCTKTKGNFVKATYYALSKIWKFHTPDLWGEQIKENHPFEQFSDKLWSERKNKN